MATRTFQQLGASYGMTPSSIVVQLDGATIFSGDVTAFDEPVPTELGDITNVAFSFTEDVHYAGTKTVSIQVSGADLYLGPTQANYSKNGGPEAPTTGADGYGSIFRGDPYSSVTIDGIEQTPDRGGNLGQWGWMIPAGSTFQATLNIQGGYLT